MIFDENRIYEISRIRSYDIKREEYILVGQDMIFEELGFMKSVGQII